LRDGFEQPNTSSENARANGSSPIAGAARIICASASDSAVTGTG